MCSVNRSLRETGIRHRQVPSCDPEWALEVRYLMGARLGLWDLPTGLYDSLLVVLERSEGRYRLLERRTGTEVN